MVKGIVGLFILSAIVFETIHLSNKKKSEVVSDRTFHASHTNANGKLDKKTKKVKELETAPLLVSAPAEDYAMTKKESDSPRNRNLKGHLVNLSRAFGGNS